MDYFIISTCGTSLLTNMEKRLPPQADKALTVTGLSNKKENELTKEEKAFLDCLFDQLEEEVEFWGVSEMKRASAEFNGLLTYYGDQTSRGQKNRHCFIHSDTYVGKQCARLMNDWCARQKLPSELFRVPGLNTADYLAFSAAMGDLARWCAEYVAPVRTPYYGVIFNLTGGFKSLQGFMQTLGMFYADETFYLFESSDALMRIPRLPVDIEASAHREIEQHFSTYRRLALGQSLRSEDIQGISESMLLTDGTNYTLSGWGQIFWDRFSRTHYKKEIYH